MGWECHACPDLKLSNRPVRTRTPGGVAGVPPTMEAPYADRGGRAASVRAGLLSCVEGLAAPLLGHASFIGCR